MLTAAAHFVKDHAAAIASVAASIAVMTGCEATLGVVTAGAATLACGAVSGAVGNAAGYAVNAAQHGGFSWSGLGKAALTGAVAGLAGGVLGSVAGLAADGLSGLAGSLLSSGEDTAGSVLASSAAGEAAGTTLDGAAAGGGAPGDTATAQAGGDATGGGAAGGDASGSGTPEEGGSAGSCGAPAPGGQSFTAGTPVLLASGAAVPVSSLKPGDTVLADDARTGKDQPEKVTAVLVHHDTDLYDLTVKTSHGTGVIHTTSNHLFWDPYHHYGWIPAKHLKPGMHLKTPDGQPAVVVGGSVPAVRDGWMWDLTVPGNNDHDFYVYVAADAAVLVHNQDLPCSEGLADFADANIGRTNVASEVTNGNGAIGRGVSMPRAPEDLTPQVRTAAQATGHHLGCAEIGGLCDLETQLGVKRS